MPEPPPPGVKPVPVSAIYDNPAQPTVVFDRTLVGGALDPTNWTWKAAGNGYSATSATASGTAVVLNGTPQANALPQERIQYDPPPADVLDLATAAPADAFIAVLEGLPP